MYGLISAGGPGLFVSPVDFSRPPTRSQPVFVFHPLACRRVSETTSVRVAAAPSNCTIRDDIALPQKVAAKSVRRGLLCAAFYIVFAACALADRNIVSELFVEAFGILYLPAARGHTRIPTTKSSALLQTESWSRDERAPRLSTKRTDITLSERTDTRPH
jgi:hypothetical protein